MLTAHIDNGVSVDEPHDPGPRVTGDSAAEARPVALVHRHRLRLGDEHGRLADPFLLLRRVRSPIPERLHLLDLLDRVHALGQLRLVDDARLALWRHWEGQRSAMGRIFIYVDD